MKEWNNILEGKRKKKEWLSVSVILRHEGSSVSIF